MLLITQPSQRHFPQPPISAAPWAELEHIPTNATIGSSLTDTTRQGLLDSIGRIEANGKHIEDWTGGRRSLSAPEALRVISKQKPQFDPEPKLYVSGFNVNAVFPLTSLDGLRRLDVIYGIGMGAAAPVEKAAHAALGDLVRHGWKFGDDKKPMQAQDVFEHLMVPLYYGRGPQAADSSHTLYIDSADHAVAINYFYGEKVDRGMADPERARAAQQLVADGYVFRDLYTEENTDPSFAYYRHGEGFAGHTGRVMLPFDDEAAHHLDTFKHRVGLAEDVCKQIFDSGLIEPADNDTDWYVGKALDDVLQNDARFGYEDRARAMVTLATAELRRQPMQALYQIIAVGHERFQRVAAVARDPKELDAVSRALGEMIASTPPDVPPSKVVDDTMVSILKALMPASEGAPRIESGDDCVVIGGVKIPRRRN